MNREEQFLIEFYISFDQNVNYQEFSILEIERSTHTQNINMIC